MVIAGFTLQDKMGKVQFFEETSFLGYTSMDVVLGVPFPTLSDADIQFVEKEFDERVTRCKGPTHHLEGWTQISSLLVKETLTTVLLEYAEFANISALDFAAELSKPSGIDDHSMDLVGGQQPAYALIYCDRVALPT